jgi:hypothetical protein
MMGCRQKIESKFFYGPMSVDSRVRANNPLRQRAVAEARNGHACGFIGVFWGYIWPFGQPLGVNTSPASPQSAVSDLLTRKPPHDATAITAAKKGY